MKPIFILLLSFTLTSTKLYQFSEESKSTDWLVVNDGVMGGLSKGTFQLNEKGNGVFQGYVSLDNNGGFSSIRHRCNFSSVNPNSSIVLRLKGDGKNYQFRIKGNRRDYYSYKNTFRTSGKWETIKIPLHEFSPTFRGRELAIPNFDKNTLQEIAFLIANEKEEEFRLEVDYINLE